MCVPQAGPLKGLDLPLGQSRGNFHFFALFLLYYIKYNY